MDEVALRVGNILVGNAQDAAALEISFLGPEIRFRADVALALTGAEVAAELDGRPVPWYQAFLARAGQTLDIRHCTRGMRAYLAVGGGIDVPVRLGSRSTSLAAGFGGTEGRPLCDGDVLSVGPIIGSPARWAGRTVPGTWRPTFALARRRSGWSWGRRTTPSPRPVGARSWRRSYEVTPSSDRMGCRLEGPAIEHAGAADIISDWIPLGGIQVPGNGKPIILLADRQTTGGYTKIATVIGPDIPKLAQVRPGDRVRFQALAIAEAQGVARTLEAGPLDAGCDPDGSHAVERRGRDVGSLLASSYRPGYGSRERRPRVKRAWSGRGVRGILPAVIWRTAGSEDGGGRGAACTSSSTGCATAGV